MVSDYSFLSISQIQFFLWIEKVSSYFFLEYIVYIKNLNGDLHVALTQLIMFVNNSVVKFSEAA